MGLRRGDARWSAGRSWENEGVDAPSSLVVTLAPLDRAECELARTVLSGSQADLRRLQLDDRATPMLLAWFESYHLTLSGAIEEYESCGGRWSGFDLRARSASPGLDGYLDWAQGQLELLVKAEVADAEDELESRGDPDD
jgi:hypothetical protein